MGARPVTDTRAADLRRLHTAARMAHRIEDDRITPRQVLGFLAGLAAVLLFCVFFLATGPR